MSSDVAFCLAEDRSDIETGLRLAILSLNRHVAGAPIFVYRPNPTEAFTLWLRRFPEVTLIPDRPAGAASWNCKPHALTPILEMGFRQAVWLDSDIMVTRDVRPLFDKQSESTVVVAQEPASLPDQGTEVRTRDWGLEIGRPLDVTLNSSVLRVTHSHKDLLARWADCMRDPRYLLAQTQPLDQRPLSMMGDQDILNALLGSREFESFPIHLIRTGTDIIHAGGALAYSVSERLLGLFKPKPTFFHASAGKPWLWLGGTEHWARKDFFGWHRRLLQEVSPYLAEARTYQRDIGLDAAWMERVSVPGLLLRMLGFGHFALRGLPVTVAATVMGGLGSRR